MLNTDQFTSSSRDSCASWFPNGHHIVVLTKDDSTTNFALVDTEKNTCDPLLESNFPCLIIPTGTDTIYWYAGQCDQQVKIEIEFHCG
jgi:hypothetical protein